ncbi:hypothetical protein ACVNSY_10685 [Bacillus sp. OHL2]
MMFELWDELKEKMLPRFQTRKSRCEEDDMLQGIVSMIAMFYWIKGRVSKRLNGNISSKRHFLLLRLIGRNV